MSFKYPKQARKYFEFIDHKSGNRIKFKTMFDIYYICAMAGLYDAQLGENDMIESSEFIELYPSDYGSDTINKITGLLIESEMRRQDIQKSDKDSIQKLILEIVEHRSPTSLSKIGVERLNQYAARGMQTIFENIAKPSNLESFMIQYYVLLNPNELID